MTIRFGCFRLDPADARLWKGDDVVPLAPRAFSVLRHLLAHPGRLVTKDELLDAVWGEIAVTDSVLKVAVAEIRRALDDPARAPRFIETVHRRGYRFVAALDAEAGSKEPGTDDPAANATLFGRDGELATLERAFAGVPSGRREVVFLTGEPGIGKTALVDAFLERARARGARVAQGQCVELLAAGEAYGPLFEAFGRLCRDAGGEEVIAELARRAPTWLVHMPGIGSESLRRRLGSEVIGAGRDRMLREIGEALEAIAAKHPLVLVLEDLHWSDTSTVDFLSTVARGRGRAQLLVLGTYRPVDLILSEHPLKGLKQELEAQRRCREIAVGGLADDAVAAWLETRFPGGGLPAVLGPSLARWTEGNPLFVASAFDDLEAREILRRTERGWELRAELAELEAEVPESVRGIVERRLDRLGEEEREVLEAASVATGSISAAVLAAALGTELLPLEDVCERLRHRYGFLRRTGRTFPGERRGSGRFELVHAIHRHVLYDRIPPARRARLHGRMGEAMEAAWGARAGEIAAELALHFERSGSAARAVEHLRRVSANAVARNAWHEAIEALDRALRLVETLPAAERSAVELDIFVERAGLLRASGDLFGAVSAYEGLLERARAERNEEIEGEAFFGLVTVLYWLDRSRALEMVNAGLELAERSSLEVVRVLMRGLWGQWNLQLTGWHEDYAGAFLEGVAYARKTGEAKNLCPYVTQHAYFLMHRADYREAVEAADEGMALAISISDAYHHMIARFFKAWALLNLGALDEMMRVVEDGLEQSRRNGSPIGERIFLFEKAWLLEEALDPGAALEIAEPALAESWEGQFDQFTGLLAVGASRLSRGDLAGARECLDGITSQLARDPLAADWIFRMPLGLRLSALALAEGDPAEARRSAEEVLTLAARSGERMYLALARRLLAESFLAEGAVRRAADEIARAEAALEGTEAPLASWRVAATAARVEEARGRSRAARGQRERAAGVLARLAESLTDEPELRARLLGAPAAGALEGGPSFAGRRTGRAVRTNRRAVRRSADG